MPLDFADFAHHYQGHGMSEAQQRAQFEPFADLMECIVRLFWRDGAGASSLGITLVGNFLPVADTVDSDQTLTHSFNGTASPEAAGKKDSCL